MTRRSSVSVYVGPVILLAGLVFFAFRMDLQSLFQLNVWVVSEYDLWWATYCSLAIVAIFVCSYFIQLRAIGVIAISPLVLALTVRFDLLVLLVFHEVNLTDVLANLFALAVMLFGGAHYVYVALSASVRQITLAVASLIFGMLPISYAFMIEIV